MKKSQSIRLVLLGGASFALASCGQNPLPSEGAKFYPTVEACAAEYGAKPCDEAKQAADKTQLTEAPRFAQKQQCEAEFGVGNCESRQEASNGGGGSFFMPMMMGYMMGNMLGGNRFSQPVYRGPDNSAIMPKGGTAYNVGRFDSVGGKPAFRQASQVAAVSRGGFGRTASLYSASAGG